MASFTEQATLLLNDKSSANIKKVNAELNKLFKTAQKLNNMKINLRGLSQVASQARTATTALNNVNRAAQNLRRPVAMNVSANTQRATAAINRLRQNAQRQVNMPIGGGVGGGGGIFGGGGRGGGGFGRPVVGGLAGFESALVRTTRQLILFQVATNTVMATLSEAGQAVMEAEDARLRIGQAGFGTERQLEFQEMTRDIQKQFNQVPAAQVLDASVEMLATMKASNKSSEQMQEAMSRVASNAQTMSVTFKDAAEGAENARMLEKLANIANLGTAEGDAAKIVKLQQETMRAVIAAGGDVNVYEAVRTARQLGSSIFLGLSEDAFADILSVRDEGGMRSTAEVRMGMRDLQRTSLEKYLKKQQAAVGLRNKDLTVNADVWKAFSENPIDAAMKYLAPKLKDFGLDVFDKSIDFNASDIAKILTEKMGFTTTGAQFFADAIASIEQVKKDREARKQVDLDPAIAADTIRGSFANLVATFDTMVATITTSINKPLADAINGFAGFLAEFGEIFKTEHVTPEDIAKRRQVGLPERLTGLPRELFTTPPQAVFDKALKELQTAIGAQADAVIGPETTGKFFQRWGQLTTDVPRKIDDATQYMRDAWQAAGENVKADSVAFKAKIGQAFDFLVEKFLELFEIPAGDTAKTRTDALNRFIGQLVADVLDSILRNLGKVANSLFSDFSFDMNFKDSPLGQLFYKKVQTPGGPQTVLKPLTDYLPAEFNAAAESVRKFAAWLGTLTVDTAQSAYNKLLQGIGIVSSAFEYIGGVVNRAAEAVQTFIDSLLNWKGMEDPRNPPTSSTESPAATEKKVLPQDLSLIDAFKAALIESTKQQYDLTPPVPAESPGPSMWESIKEWFKVKEPAFGAEGGTDVGALSDAVRAALSPSVQAAIDGITQGGAQAATSVQSGFITGGTSAGASMQAAIIAGGQAAANAMLAAIQNATTTVNVNVSGGGGYRPDTGAVGTPALVG